MEKTCSKCKTDKPLASFGKRSAAQDGLRSQCRECDAAYAAKNYPIKAEQNRARQAKWRAANPELAKLKLAEWRAKNPEKTRAARKAWEAANPGAVAKLNKKWNDANRWKMARRNREHYAQNREYFARANKQWHQANPEAARVIARRGRAARMGAEGSFTKADIDRLKALQGDKCPYCRKALNGKYHIDHIKPASKADPIGRRTCNCSVHHAISRRKTKCPRSLLGGWAI